MSKLYDLIIKQVNKEIEHKTKGINEILIATDYDNHIWLIVDSCAAFRVLNPWIFDTEKLLAIFHQSGEYRGITNMLKDFEGVPVQYIGTRVEKCEDLHEFIDKDKPLGTHGYMRKKYFDILIKLQNENFSPGVLECDFEKCIFKWELYNEPVAIIWGYKINK